jgi:hypothetical protein
LAVTTEHVCANEHCVSQYDLLLKEVLGLKVCLLFYFCFYDVLQKALDSALYRLDIALGILKEHGLLSEYKQALNENKD